MTKNVLILWVFFQWDIGISGLQDNISPWFAGVVSLPAVQDLWVDNHQVTWITAQLKAIT